MTNNTAIIIEPDAMTLARKGAELFAQNARESAHLRGRFVVAISGGSTPRLMHRLLCREPHLSKIPWSKTHIFWVDERCVPQDHEVSNYGAARDDFLSGVSIPEEQVHPMPVHVSPEKGALAYQGELVRFFQPGNMKIPVLDLIFLGLGTDGHTASLFPGQSALADEEKLIVSVRGGKPDVSRMTMTFPLLNSGREIVFMVSGKNKARVLKTVFDEPEARLPVQKIQLLNGKLTWLLDRDAALLLTL
ncbi:MAG: 6-phosphogluconolactonase [Pseudomonadota bacterium]